MKMMSPAVWAFLALGAIWLGVPVCNAALGDSAGCENAKWIDNLHSECPEKFKDACNRFDACYKCGTTFNVEQNRCNDAFLPDLEELCKEGKKDGRHLQPDVSPVLRSPIYLQGKFMQHRTDDTCSHDAEEFNKKVITKVGVSDSKCSDHPCYNQETDKEMCKEFKKCMPNA